MKWVNLVFASAALVGCTNEVDEPLMCEGRPRDSSYFVTWRPLSDVYVVEVQGVGDFPCKGNVKAGCCATALANDPNVQSTPAAGPQSSLPPISCHGKSYNTFQKDGHWFVYGQTGEEAYQCSADTSQGCCRTVEREVLFPQTTPNSDREGGHVPPPP